MLPARVTSYLYIERSASGALSYGSTTVEPVRQASAPKAEMDKMHYNTVAEKMYLYNGVQWKPVLRIIVAIVVTDSTSVKSIKYYRPGFGGDVMADKSISSSKIGDGEVKSVNIGEKQVTSAHLEKSITDMFDAVRKDIDALKPKINEVLTKAYPVGAIYCSTVSTNPTELFGFGTWEYIEQGRVLLSQGNKYNAGTTGGAETHTLTVAEMPSHKHGGTTGDGGAHTHTGIVSEAGEHTHTGILYHSGNQGNTYRAIIRTEVSPLKPSQSKVSDVYISNAGAHNHDVTINGASNHTHTINTEGEGQEHSIMQPYLSVYMWKRVS